MVLKSLPFPSELGLFDFQLRIVSKMQLAAFRREL